MEKKLYMINKLIQLMKAKPVSQKIPEQVLCTEKKNRGGYRKETP